VTPRASVGVLGGEAAPLHANDATVSVRAQVNVGDHVYVVLRPAYALQLAPPSMTKDASLAGRSTPYVLLAVGAKN
jgi:hypothetical protein